MDTAAYFSGTNVSFFDTFFYNSNSGTKQDKLDSMAQQAPVVTPATSMANIADLGERLGRWQERLRNATELQVPTDYPRPIPLKVVEAVSTFELSSKTSRTLLRLAL
ncbi:large subunit of alpha-aminoadipate reductase, partial [Coemansia sp. RSA 1285]